MKSSNGQSRTAKHTPSEVSTKPGYLRKAAAAKYLGVSLRTLSDWTRMRIVPHIKPSNRVCLFKVSDLDMAMGRYRTSAVGEAVF